MSYYKFRQNNTGGSFDFDHDKGVSVIVWIEAGSPQHAIVLAERIGIYFDGVADGRDCGCCGDRWYDGPEEQEYPTVWGADSEIRVPSTWAEYDATQKWHFGKWCKNGPEGYVHHADGRIEAVLA